MVVGVGVGSVVVGGVVVGGVVVGGVVVGRGLEVVIDWPEVVNNG